MQLFCTYRLYAAFELCVIRIVLIWKRHCIKFLIKYGYIFLLKPLEGFTSCLSLL